MGPVVLGMGFPILGLYSFGDPWSPISGGFHIHVTPGVSYSVNRVNGHERLGLSEGGALDSGVIETYDTGKYCEFVAVCIVTTLASAQNK